MCWRRWSEEAPAATASDEGTDSTGSAVGGASVYHLTLGSFDSTHPPTALLPSSGSNSNGQTRLEWPQIEAKNQMQRGSFFTETMSILGTRLCCFVFCFFFAHPETLFEFLSVANRWIVPFLNSCWNIQRPIVKHAFHNIQSVKDFNECENTKM